MHNSMRSFDFYVKSNFEVNEEWLKEVSVPPFSQFSNIHEKVYLTSVGALTRENMIAFDIKCIIDFAKEYEYEMRGVEHIKFKNFTDTEDCNIESLFDEVADGINSVVENGQNVVVHCFAGCSRSATMVLAYLIKHKGYSFKNAFLLERKQRPVVRPNNGFFKQLLRFEKSVYGNSSAEVIKLKRDGVEIEVPDFFVTELPDLVENEFKEATRKRSKRSLRRSGQ